MKVGGGGGAVAEFGRSLFRATPGPSPVSHAIWQLIVMTPGNAKTLVTSLEIIVFVVTTTECC